MSSISRSTDVTVRKSPSVSATVYPKGHVMQGNDGNQWEIIVDSRGVHRWQKRTSTNTYTRPVGLPTKGIRTETRLTPLPSVIINSDLEESTKEYVKQCREAIQSNRYMKDEIEKQVRERKANLEILADDGDDEAAKSAKVLRLFLRESFKYGGRISRMEEMQSAYEDTVFRTPRHSEKMFLLNKLSEMSDKIINFN